jgi:hypothetical protein
MGLTQKKEQSLEAVGLIKFYGAKHAVWRALAKKSYDFFRGNLPADSRVRPDDVAKVLEPMAEVNKDLRHFLNEKKLKQKYWVSDFTDLVIDRTWGDISKGEANAEKKE